MKGMLMTALRRDGARRWAGLLAAGSVLAGLLTAAAPGAASAAAAAPCVSMTGTQPPNPGSGDNALAGVAVRSPCDAWAVGFSGGVTNNNGQLRTFIVHWDGARWTQVP